MWTVICINDILEPEYFAKLKIVYIKFGGIKLLVHGTHSFIGFLKNKCLVDPPYDFDQMFFNFIYFFILVKLLWLLDFISQQTIHGLIYNFRAFSLIIKLFFKISKIKLHSKCVSMYIIQILMMSFIYGYLWKHIIHLATKLIHSLFYHFLIFFMNMSQNSFYGLNQAFLRVKHLVFAWRLEGFPY